ncbi:MAG: hypothetical protein A2X82_13590 [Geobacteraceae bacterium GWC2_55_20]|nr:MAG: hypothetical protein A2X82_13590 [Geobacteraceae bacterium GWC2_55_20]
MANQRDNKKSEAANLRLQAEDKLIEKKSEQSYAHTEAGTQKLIHELDVHRIELEMQNAELCQARDEVETSLEKYTDLYDFSPTGYFTLDCEGIVRSVNLTGCVFLGVERTRVIGQPFALFVDEVCRPLFSDFCGRLFSTRDKVSCELILTSQKKATLYVQLIAIASGSGQECRVAVIDITRSKRAEELQLVNERIYRAIGEEINYGIWVCAPDGRNIYASDSFLRLVGITQQQCSDFGWGNTLHPDDAERTISAWKECVKNEGHWEIEHRFRGMDGQWHHILARGVPIRNESGAITCWAGINLDISRLRQAENEKNKSEELNLKTLQALPDSIAVIDSSGRIISVNQAWIDFALGNDADGDFGVTAGVNYLDVCRRAAAENDADAERALSGIEAVLKGREKRFAMEYPCHSPHQKQWFLMTVVSLGSHGEYGAVISHSNISERKLYDERLQSIHEDLEEGIRVRTAELTKLNLQLKKEVEDRKKAEKSLLSAYAEIKQMKNRLKAENIYLQQEVAQKHNFGELIGQSSALSDVVLRVSQVAPMNATVLLLGETGVGKGVVARAIHSLSTRKGQAMITVNCSTLPANLIESELFGRERGAFTGSSERQIGRFELADGGTIFLDEIGEMPIELQSKLLRIIQDGEFERLGSPRTIKTNVRIIAASNRNLEEQIRKGCFREDLYYRLNVFPITIPPLRQRQEDIPLLVRHFIALFNKKNNRNIETVPHAIMKTLQQYFWPGNVRELESVIERAVITTQGTTLQVLDRFDTFQIPDKTAGQNVKALIEVEHDHILQVLEKNNWRIEGKKGAALQLGLNPSTLRARMRKYGIQRQ